MILVTGATGNVGGDLVRQLLDAGRAVRALVRSREQNKLPAAVERVEGDLDRPESLESALKGVDGAFLLGGRKDMPGLLRSMKKAGVGHVALLSSRSVIGGQPSNAIVAMWQESEDAVRSSGIPWTILQPSSFMSNALRWLPQLRTGDVVRVPFADVPIAAIDPHDIAAVAALALTSEGHAFKAHVLSGPRALLPAEQLRVLSAVLGRNLRLERLSSEQTSAELAASFPPSLVDAFFRFYERGEFDDSIVLPTVQELTGEPPRTFEQWARGHADAFR